MMILLDDRCIEMQCGQHDQVARPLFEHLIEIPDFEMMPHADQQRALPDAAARAHPRRDRDPPLAVHLRGRDEAEAPSQQRIARTAFPVRSEFAVLIDDARAVIDEHAGIVGVKTDEQILASAA
ncbi:hypothetical protein [Sphingomonas sp. PP-CE-3G-477]|uniref:hypothetical protein n=1 Tax=Sphingomonas sp. PP-CE-3G-477 TaxID=2135660 RepID=UPI00215911BE|nr:hypothetical protein [Sphingomonas sp. PP-CE-3G-477]